MSRHKVLAALGALCATTGLIHCWSKMSDPMLTSECDGAALGNVTLSYGTAYVVNPTTTTTTTTTTSSMSSDGGNVNSLWSDASSMVSTTSSAPATVFVPITVAATFGCKVEGTAHASLSTSVGQLTNGLPAASSPGGGGAEGGAASASAGAGTTGAAGTAIVVLLTNVQSQGSSAGNASSNVSSSQDLEGYATLQLTFGRQTQLQAVVGDVATCTQLSVAAAEASGPLTAQITPSACP